MKKETVFVKAVIALLLVAAVLTGCSQLSAPVAAGAAVQVCHFKEAAVV